VAQTTLILAIEPDKRQAAHLTSMARHTLKAEIILADSADRALASLGDRVPDLILTPALLPPRDETAIAERLRQLNSRAAHVQTLTVPVLATPRRNSPARGVLSALRRDKSADGPVDGCDPAVFAEQVADYLERATAERAAHLAAIEHQAHAPAVEARSAVVPEQEPIHAVIDADPYVASVQPETSADAVAVEEWTAPEPEAPAVVEAPAAAAPEPVFAVADPDPYVATVLDQAAPVVQSAVETHRVDADHAEPSTREEAAAVRQEPEVLPVLEFLVSDDAPVALNDTQASSYDAELTLDAQASLDALDVIELADPLPDLTDEGFEGFDPQMLSALLPDAYPVLEVVSDELDASEEAEADAGDEIDLAPLLETEPPHAAEPFEPAGAAAIIAAVAAIERSMATSAPPPPDKTARVWVPLRFDTHPLWPPMQGVEAEPPAPGATLSDPALSDPASLEMAVRQPTALKKKKVKSKPAQDEWGLFDPAQCGFAALLAKLEEITEKEDARSA
jgi:hypothetical protein